eukprot:1644106-Rhodomonas_salina.3
MRGTDIAYGATSGSSSGCVCYAMSGTDAGYQAAILEDPADLIDLFEGQKPLGAADCPTQALQYVLGQESPQCCLVTLWDIRYSPRACFYWMRQQRTDEGYGATR